ncbi:UV DNA damage repair endonuclease UvsE [Clostridium cuniculi]|uniref:UV DNA damage repair endonuclease UvsE n=1 Tax=Clostridium cuniculi TaxID=2548455 RepID=UPI001055BF29|nr:UV DNA damage repair endonuclease UvsE [Clostridium cuniculi]
MRVRLGYVAISKKLGKKVTSSSTVTFSNYNKITLPEKKLEKLRSVAASNLRDLETLIRYNIDNNIHFYRITSALIPLVTHPEVGYWGHREFLKKDFEYVGKLINDSKMRVDTHPDEFNVINSINPKVVENTKINLLRQAEWFEDFKYDLGKMVIHIGGATNGKKAGLERFITNFATFPYEVKSKIIIENDDKTYTAQETLNLCNELNLPMVLDVHHHNCNNNGENIYELIPKIFLTWKKEKLPPKLHFSSPRDGEKDRKHSDFINANDFITFLENIKSFNTDIDIMLECKEKDLALFKLADDIKVLKPEYKWVDKSTFIV